MLLAASFSWKRFLWYYVYMWSFYEAKGEMYIFCRIIICIIILKQNDVLFIILDIADCFELYISFCYGL